MHNRSELRQEGYTIIEKTLRRLRKGQIYIRWNAETAYSVLGKGGADNVDGGREAQEIDLVTRDWFAVSQLLGL
jgi:hypothetical protein